jgi:hypothetical protein
MTIVSRAELADLVDERKAAEFLRLSIKTLQAARQDPLLQAACVLPAHERQGGRVFYRREELEAVLDARLARPRLKRKYDAVAA